jgi:hypothetical protein
LEEKLMLERHDLDFYETPQKLTECLLKHWQPDENDTILEPCGGHGAISRIFEKRGFSVITNDIDLDKPADYHLDVSIASNWKQLPIVDWVVTNPPFKKAPAIIPCAYEKAQKGVIALLRLSYLEPTRNRQDWLKTHPLSLLISLNPRPQFRQDTKSTDSATVCWYIWPKNYKGDTTIKYETDWES